jgi:2,3-bisphosphoglycerate-independent phosphoglycerate mutase
MKNAPPKPVCLIILDGWAHPKIRQPLQNLMPLKSPDNLTWTRLWQEYPHTLLDASGKVVGLPR